MPCEYQIYHIITLSPIPPFLASSCSTCVTTLKMPAQETHNYMALLCNADCCDDLHGTNTVSYHQWIGSEVVGSLLGHVINQFHYVLHKPI